MDQAVNLSLPATPEEFLAWEESQDERYEFDGRRPVPMDGGTREHALIERNIVSELRTRLRGSRCEGYGGTMKVAVGPAFRYPDASISCTPVPRGSVTIPAPVVLFEVVSPGSRTTDHVVKLAEYRTLTSVQLYVLVEQHEVLLTVHARGASGWTTFELGAGEVLHLGEIGVDLRVDDFYEDVFPRS